MRDAMNTETLTLMELEGLPEVVLREPSTIRDQSAAAAQVDSIWEQACKQNPRLHDGPIFNVQSAAKDQIVGYWNTYRWYYATHRHGIEAAVSVLAVTGVVLLSDGRILIARRSSNATQRADTWDLLPAGSVDVCTADGQPLIQQALLTELEEELGMAAASVDPVPAGLIVDAEQGTTDVIFLLRAREDAVIVTVGEEHNAIDRVYPRALTNRGMPVASLRAVELALRKSV